MRVWAQMPHVPGKRRSSAQNVACRTSMAAINSRKKDKENLNPSNSDDLDTVSRSLYSTTVNKLIAVKKKLHNVSRKLGRSMAKNTSLGDQLSRSEHN